MIIKNIDADRQATFTTNKSFIEYLLHGASPDKFMPPEHAPLDKVIGTKGFMVTELHPEDEDEETVVLITFDGGAAIIAPSESIFSLYDDYIETQMME